MNYYKQNSMNKGYNRKEFFRMMSFAGASTLIPQIVAASAPVPANKRISLANDDVILFQGDSITDAGRYYKEKRLFVPRILGTGYVFIAAAELMKTMPEKKLNIYNRGVSGNKVVDMAARWEKDCLAVKPRVLSILIGVNDYWHTLIEKIAYKGTIDTYRSGLRTLIHQTLQRLPDVKLIIGEPYAVRSRVVTEKWFPAFDEYRAAAKAIAEEAGAVFIPFQSVFDEASRHAPGTYWAYDGVHPSIAGGELMAQAWMQAIKR